MPLGARSGDCNVKHLEVHSGDCIVRHLGAYFAGCNVAHSVTRRFVAHSENWLEAKYIGARCVGCFVGCSAQPLAAQHFVYLRFEKHAGVTPVVGARLLLDQHFVALCCYSAAALLHHGVAWLPRLRCAEYIYSCFASNLRVCYIDSARYRRSRRIDLSV